MLSVDCVTHNGQVCVLFLIAIPTHGKYSKEKGKLWASAHINELPVSLTITVQSFSLTVNLTKMYPIKQRLLMWDLSPSSQQPY